MVLHLAYQDNGVLVRLIRCFEAIVGGDEALFRVSMGALLGAVWEQLLWHCWGRDQKSYTIVVGENLWSRTFV